MSLTIEQKHDRLHAMKETFFELGFGNAELLEGWDGDDVSELRDLLTEEEFETLLDHLGDDER